MRKSFFILLASLSLSLSAQIETKTYSIVKGEREERTVTLINPTKLKKDFFSDEWSLKVIYANGQVKREGQFYKELWQGVWRRYNKDGTLIFEGEFNRGMGVGMHKYYYYSGKIKEIRSFQSGMLHGETYQFEENGDTTMIEVYRNNELDKQISFYSNQIKEKAYENGKLNGSCITKNRKGVIIQRGQYLDNYKIGEWICFDSLGKKINSYIFSKLDSAAEIQKKDVCELSLDKISTEKVFLYSEVMPEFVGGEKALMMFIRDNIQYPTRSRDADIQGRIIIGFEVSKDGDVEYINPKGKNPYSDLTEESIRVVEMLPKFKPGTQEGKAVRVAYVLPLVYRLQ